MLIGQLQGNMQNLKTTVARYKHWLSPKIGIAGAGLHANGSESLLPTAFAVIATELGGCSFISAEKRQLVELIQSCQRTEAGLFDPGELCRSDLSSHSATYIRLQATYFAIHALDVLNAQPKRRVEFVHELQKIDYLRGWLDGGPWSNPWLHSNHVMFALTFLQTDHLWNSDEASLDAFDAVLDYLDERQDPVTGLWQPDDGVDIRNAVYAAYHFFPYYFWRGRKPEYVEQIIDSTLSIQDPDGLYGGGACEDLDAVHTLVMMTLVSDHRTDEVRQSLERCFWRLLQLQNQDGGFSNYAMSPQVWKGWKRRWAERTGLINLLPMRLQNRGESAPSSWCYSGWKQLECPYGVSDTWGAWFRPLALKLIADQYPDIAGEFPIGKYRSLPGLGWHDTDQIRAASNVRTLTKSLSR